MEISLFLATWILIFQIATKKELAVFCIGDTYHLTNLIQVPTCFEYERGTVRYNTKEEPRSFQKKIVFKLF